MGNKLEELESLIEDFCKKEYSNGGRTHSIDRMSGKSFVLYSVDSGGYDVSGDITFILEDGEMTIEVVTDRKNYKPIAWKTFKLKLIDD